MCIDETYKGVDFSVQKMKGTEYDGCVFDTCIFSSHNFSNISFLDCTFENCNFTQVVMKKIALKEVVFQNCKLVGVDFSEVDDLLFSVIFKNSTLEYSTFL